MRKVQFMAARGITRPIRRPIAITVVRPRFPSRACNALIICATFMKFGRAPAMMSIRVVSGIHSLRLIGTTIPAHLAEHALHRG
jgi:hypothetical protein